VHDIAAAAPSTQAAPPNASSADAAPAPAPPSAEPFHFTGKAGEYFGIWIVNLFLTIVTLGIYSAWAKVRKKRYFYGNTWVAGANFDFHGNPVAILKGRLLAFAAFAAYTLAGHYSPKVAALIALAIMPAVPWLLVRSFAFNALNSSYRNLRFHFRAGYADGLRAIWPLFLVPALIVFLYVGTEQSVWDWQVTYFMRQLSMDNVAAARVLSIFPIAIMLGRLVTNRLLMRMSPTPVLLVSTIGATLCFAMVMLATTAGLAAGALLVCGLFMASIFPTALGIVSSRFPTASGTALGLAITGGWLGSVAVSPTFGWVAQHTDFSRAYLVIVGSAAVMALSVVWLARQGGAAEVHPAAAGLGAGTGTR